MREWLEDIWYSQIILALVAGFLFVGWRFITWSWHMPSEDFWLIYRLISFVLITIFTLQAIGREI